MIYSISFELCLALVKAPLRSAISLPRLLAFLSCSFISYSRVNIFPSISWRVPCFSAASRAKFSASYLERCCSLALLATAGLVSAQHPPPHHCETPTVWGADIITHRHQSGSHEGEFGVRSHVWQDGERHRFATYDIEDSRGHSQERFHRIFLFYHDVHHRDGGEEFRIDLNTKKCTRHELKGDFYPLEIPRDAEFHGQQYIGSNAQRDGSILTNFYSAYHNDTRGSTRWEGIFTAGDVGCWPVEETFEQHANPNSVYQTSRYFNFVNGISDPSVFEPPANCN